MVGLLSCSLICVFVPGCQRCVDFEPQPSAGTQYGPPGNTSGQVVFTGAGISLSVLDFQLMGGGMAFNLARIETPPVPFAQGQSIRTNNIDLEFGFGNMRFPVRKVAFRFLDLGGFENLAVNGSAVYIGELTTAPASLGGVTVSVTTSPVPGGKMGEVRLAGKVRTVRVGGQELWIDKVCALGP